MELVGAIILGLVLLHISIRLEKLEEWMKVKIAEEEKQKEIESGKK